MRNRLPFQTFQEFTLLAVRDIGDAFADVEHQLQVLLLRSMIAAATGRHLAVNQRCGKLNGIIRSANPHVDRTSPTVITFRGATVPDQIDDVVPDRNCDERFPFSNCIWSNRCLMSATN